VSPQSQEMDTKRLDPQFAFLRLSILSPCAMGTEASFEPYLLEHPRKTRVGRLYKQEHNYCYKKARTLRRCYTRCYTSYGQRTALHMSLPR
jgi:hypothetical protein